jgi:hypothetical protein
MRIVRGQFPNYPPGLAARCRAVWEINNEAYETIRMLAKLEGDTIPADLIEQMLAVTPYTGGPEGLDDRRQQDGWLSFMMSVHEASGGAAADLFIAWSQADPEYGQRDAARG